MNPNLLYLFVPIIVLWLIFYIGCRIKWHTDTVEGLFSWVAVPYLATALLVLFLAIEFACNKISPEESVSYQLEK